MHQRNQETRANDGGGRPASTVTQQRSTTHRITDGADRAPHLDLALVCSAIGLSLIAIPLLVGYTFVLGTTPSPGSTAFYVLGAVVMAPGVVMGTAALWLCARSDPPR